MNSREYCLLKTKELGTILLMEVGALMVGKINNHEEDSAQVKRGDEKGMFEFGGSTIVVMTEPGMAEPDKGYYPQYKSTGRDIGKNGRVYWL